MSANFLINHTDYMAMPCHKVTHKIIPIMKIWIDISNSPHVNMFYDLIRELESEGHTIIITSRPLANTIALLDQKGLNHTAIGEHYGKNILKKISGYPVRIFQLYNFLKKYKPDLAISQSSFHSPIVAKLLGIPSIYTNDNEHALGNIPAFIFATKILIPENIPKNRIANNFVNIKKIIQYPGIKEGIYLWNKYLNIRENRVLNKTKSIEIYFRPEPRTAQYYKGSFNFIDNIIIALQKKYIVNVLPRDQEQTNHYSNKNFGNTHVVIKPKSLENIAESCTLFIGAGGSMTRELAILGVPTISIYQDELLEVDRYLISKNIMTHDAEITLDKIESMIQCIKEDETQPEMMIKGKKAYALFKSEILLFNTIK